MLVGINEKGSGNADPTQNLNKKITNKLLPSIIINKPKKHVHTNIKYSNIGSFIILLKLYASKISVPLFVKYISSSPSSVKVSLEKPSKILKEPLVCGISLFFCFWS